MQCTIHYEDETLQMRRCITASWRRVEEKLPAAMERSCRIARQPHVAMCVGGDPRLSWCLGFRIHGLQHNVLIWAW